MTAQQNPNDLATELFSAQSNERRQEVEAALTEWGSDWRRPLAAVRDESTSPALAYVSLTSLEPVVCSWPRLNSAEKDEIRNSLIDLLFQRQWPQHLLNKFCTVIARIARWEWPHIWTDYLSFVLQFSGKQEHSATSLRLLLISLEEFVCVPLDDYELRERLERAVLMSLPDVINFLVPLLQNESSRSDILPIISALLSQDALSSALSPLLPALLQLPQEPAALACLAELLLRPRLRTVEAVDACSLLVLQLMRDVSQLSDDLVYSLDELLDVLMPTVSALRRESLPPLLASFITYTFAQRQDETHLLRCVTLWSELIAAAQKHDANAFLDQFSEQAGLMASELVGRLFFSATPALHKFGIHAVSSGSSFRWREYTDGMLELLFRIVLHFPDELLSEFNKALATQSAHTMGVIDRYSAGQDDTELLTCLTDLGTLATMAGRAASLFTDPSLCEERFPLLADMYFKLIELTKSAHRKGFHLPISSDLSLAVCSALPFYFATLLAAVHAFIGDWLTICLICITDSQVAVLDASVDELLLLASECVMAPATDGAGPQTEVVGHVRQQAVFLLQAGLRHNHRQLINSRPVVAVRDWAASNALRELPTESAHVLINMLSSSLCQTGSEAEHAKFVGTVLTPLVHWGAGDAVPMRELCVLLVLLDSLPHSGCSSRASRQLFYTNIAGIVKVLLTRLPEHLSDPAATSLLLQCIKSLVETLQPQLGAPLVQSLVQLLISLFDGADRFSQQLASPVGSQVVVTYLEILTRMVSEPSPSFKTFLTPVLDQVLTQLWPLVNQDAVAVRTAALELLRSFLVNNFRYFFASTILTSPDDADVVKNSEQLSLILQVFGECLFSADLNVVKTAAGALQLVDRRCNLFSRAAFRSAVSAHFVRALLTLLRARTHALLADDIAELLFRLAKTDKAVFSETHLRPYIASLNLSAESAASLQPLLQNKHLDDLPTFRLALERFLGKSRCFV